MSNEQSGNQATTGDYATGDVLKAARRERRDWWIDVTGLVYCFGIGVTLGAGATTLVADLWLHNRHSAWIGVGVTAGASLLTCISVLIQARLKGRI